MRPDIGLCVNGRAEVFRIKFQVLAAVAGGCIVPLLAGDVAQVVDETAVRVCVLQTVCGVVARGSGVSRSGVFNVLWLRGLAAKLLRGGEVTEVLHDEVHVCRFVNDCICLGLPLLDLGTTMWMETHYV